jgi:hypothetical protein
MGNAEWGMGKFEVSKSESMTNVQMARLSTSPSPPLWLCVSILFAFSFMSILGERFHGSIAAKPGAEETMGGH